MAGRRVLEDVTLQVSGGECLRLAGARQSGRTTLLRILATLVAPTSGTLWVDGINGLAEPLRARRRVAYVSARMLAGAGLTVSEYLWVVARTRGVDPRPRIDDFARRAALDPHADVDRLSDSDRASLAVAAALVARPAAVLFDNALRDVAPAARLGLIDAIREARDGGAALVVVSDQQDELTTLCGRIVTLSAGRVLSGLPRLSLPHTGEAAWARQ